MSYGPIIHLKFGEIPVYIVSSKQVAMDVLTASNHVFASRSPLHALKVLTYNYTDFVMAPYGPYLQQIRRISFTNLFNPERVRAFKSIREEEVSNLIRYVSSNARSGSVINISKMLLSLGLSVNSRAAFGGKSKYQEEYMKMVPDITALSARPSLSDIFPSMKFLNLVHLQAIRPKLKKLHKRIDEILEDIIMEHKAKRENGCIVREDLLHALLDVQDRGELLTTDNIKAIMMDIFTNAETSSTTLEWAMSELMRNPEVMKKAQTEVRQVFSEEGCVDEARFDELNYLDSIIKETLRLHPPIPLMAPRESSAACEVNGYEIPEKSWVIVNIWAIGRDPNYWNDAEMFRPERFLDGRNDYNRGSLPFGLGERICPGKSFGIAILKIAIANLLYHFDWKLSNGGMPEDLDMTEVFVTSAPRKHELLLVPIARHLDR